MGVYLNHYQSRATNFSRLTDDFNHSCLLSTEDIKFNHSQPGDELHKNGCTNFDNGFSKTTREGNVQKNRTSVSTIQNQFRVDKTSTICNGATGNKDQKRQKNSYPHELKVSSAQSLAPMLPPCRVCGEKASGFHYGANTCEACKGFFRRSLYRKEGYHCLGSNKCTILSGSRNTCASCRYRKCVSVGMSKNAIKTGRYTHEKKTRDIREVKRLQSQQQHISNNGAQGQMTDYGCNALNEYDVNEIVERIMAIHLLQTPHTREFYDKLPSKEQEYLTSRQLQHNVFGSLKPIACQEYFKIYHITGIDLDGRRAMMEHMIPCIEKAVKRFVAFAKAIPGFKDFPIEDQIILIKGSRFEAWLVSTYRAFNADHLIYTHFCGYTVHLEDMARIYDDNFLHSVFKVAKMIKKLDLTEDEECILKAILLLFRDRSPLQAADQVEDSQLKMIDVLQYIHNRRKPNDRLFFARVISVLIELRTLTDLHMVQESKINMEWATNVQMPPLLYDLFSV